MTSEPFEDGKIVTSGKEVCEWHIRQWAHTDRIAYDWIADKIGGDYNESDELFDSIEEAKRDLGVS